MKRGIEDYAKDTIRRLVTGVQDAGFLRTILEARWREDSEDDEIIEDSSGEPPLTKAIYIRNLSNEYRPPFLCDMYFVAPELQTYWLYEIEDTHPISAKSSRNSVGGLTTSATKQSGQGVLSSLIDGAVITAACITTRRAPMTRH